MLTSFICHYEIWYVTKKLLINIFMGMGQDYVQRSDYSVEINTIVINKKQHKIIYKKQYFTVQTK